MKIDLHSHTLCSKDCRNRYDQIIEAVQRSHLDGIAVTDHDQFEGAIELQRRAPFLVIAGEEIKTDAGEIIGLFLQEWIPPGLDPIETVERIHDQGGMAYVPHPFDEVRGSRIRPDALERIAPHIDMLEVFNARNALPRFNQRALEFARERGIFAGAGSDAHTYAEYGRAYIDVPPFSNATEFRDGLHVGTWAGRLSSPLVHARTRVDRSLKVLGLTA